MDPTKKQAEPEYLTITLQDGSQHLYEEPIPHPHRKDGVMKAVKACPPNFHPDATPPFWWKELAPLTKQERTFVRGLCAAEFHLRSKLAPTVPV